MKDRCRECGVMAELGPDRVCTWRAGCEHRVLQHEAEVARSLAAMALLDPLPCGHTPADHEATMRKIGFLQHLACVMAAYPPGWLPVGQQLLTEGPSEMGRTGPTCTTPTTSTDRPACHRARRVYAARQMNSRAPAP